MKVCSKCGVEKSLSEFHKNKAREDGLCTRCITCRLIERKLYRDNNREKINQYEKGRRDKIFWEKYRERNRERLNECRRIRYKQNPKKYYSKKRWNNYTKKQRQEKWKKDSKRMVENLTDKYVKQLIKQRGLEAPPQPLLELMRNALKLKRELKNIKHDNSKSNLRIKNRSGFKQVHIRSNTRCSKK